MNVLSILKDKSFLIITVMLAIFIVTLGNLSPILISLVTLAFFVSIWKERFILYFIIITSLTVVGELNPTLRLFVNIIDILALFYLFFKKYEFKFESYPKVNSRLILYIFFLLFLMLITSTLSKNILAGYTLFVKTTIFFAIVYMLYALIDGERQIAIFRNSVVISAIVLLMFSFFSMIQKGLNIFEINTWIYLRFSGLISNPNGVAAFYAIVIPWVVGEILVNARENRKIHIVTLTLLIIGLLFTVSRGAFLSLSVSFLFVLVFLYRKILIRIVVSMGIVALIIAIIPEFNDTFTTLIRLEEGVSQRDILWQLSINMIKNNFWFGVGPGSFTAEIFNNFPVMLDSWHGIFLKELAVVTEGSNISHNFYLNFFSEMGIIGLVIAILLPVIYFSIGASTIKMFAENKVIYTRVLILVSIGAGLFVRGFFEGINLITFGWITMDLPFWLVFATILYYNSKGKSLRIDETSGNY